MRNIPAATQRFDQLDARRHLLHPEVQRRPLIAQQSGLRSNHIEVTVQAGLVAGVGEGQVALRRFDGGILLLKFLGQDSQR
jgi:hypothetical protein